MVLDHTSGFEGLLLVDDDLLGVSVWLDTAENGFVGLKALGASWFVLCSRSLSVCKCSLPQKLQYPGGSELSWEKV